MDPITTAIVAALAAGVTSGVTEAGKKTVVDAYGKLKAMLKERLGDDSDVADAVEKLEKKPDSEPRKGLLHEAVTDAKADQDDEILAAAQALLEKIKAQPGGEEHIKQVVIDSKYVAQASGGGSATVTIGQLPGDPTTDAPPPNLL